MACEAPINHSLSHILSDIYWYVPLRRRNFNKFWDWGKCLTHLGIKLTVYLITILAELFSMWSFRDYVFGSIVAKIDFDWISFVKLTLVKCDFNVKWSCFDKFTWQWIEQKIWV